MNTNPTTMVRQFVAISVVMLVVSAAWAADTSPPTASGMSAVGAWLPVAEFRQETATPSVLLERASGFASVLAGSDISVAEPGVATKAFAATPGRAEFTVKSVDGKRVLTEATPNDAVQADAGNYDLVSDDELAADALALLSAKAEPAERIRVLVDTTRNEMLAVNGTVADDFTSKIDVGAVRARAFFRETMKAITVRQLVPTDVLALGAVRTSRLMQGERAWDGPVKTRVKEYLFEVPYAIGGIEVFGASTTVAVHRSGQLASIRTAGPAVSASPTQEIFQRTLSSESLEQRAQSEHPNAKIFPIGLRYPWQATDDTALAARPRETFQVVPMTEVDGRTVYGRSQFVFYSVEDEREAPLVWPKINP